MKRLLSVVAALVMGLGLTAVVAQPAQAAVDLTAPFSREPVFRGDVDKDQYNIEHVYDVQYRLRWLGLLDATPNGVFGPQTEHAVKRFQRRLGLSVTGRVTATTWAPLIQADHPRQGRGPEASAAPTAGTSATTASGTRSTCTSTARCTTRGWSAAAPTSTQTRTGNFTVQWRDMDHRSRTYGGAPMPYSQFFSGGQALHGSRNMMDPWVGPQPRLRELLGRGRPPAVEPHARQEAVRARVRRLGLTGPPPPHTGAGPGVIRGPLRRPTRRTARPAVTARGGRGRPPRRARAPPGRSSAATRPRCRRAGR